MTDPNAANYEQQAASATGIPLSVVKQQAIAESGEGSNNGPSSAGAMGFWQFLPSTYNSLAQQAGVPLNSMSNAADETKVYIVYMKQLLNQEGGSIFKALEAYNAGPGNLSAGAGYASGIESKAGVPQSAKAGSASADLTGVHIPGTGITVPTPSDITNGIVGALGGVVSDVIKGFLQSLGLPSLKDMFQRLALILLGAMLVFIGIRMLATGGGSKQVFTINTGGGGGGSSKTAVSKSAPKTKVLSSGGTQSLGSSEAIDAAVAA